jgi:VWFA-related protein
MKSVTLLFGLMGAASLTQQPTFRSTTALVRIEVNVTDAKGPVEGLQVRDFALSDNGVVQRLTVEELKDTPLDLVAVAQPLESLRLTSQQQAPRIGAGFSAFLDHIGEQDRLAVLLADTPTLRLRAMSFGKPRLDVSSIEGSQYAATFDAITAGLAEFLPTERRCVLVAFTNAADFRSTVTLDGLVRQARRLGPAFVLFGSPTEVSQSVNVRAEVRGGPELARATAVVRGFVFPSVLRELARRTGGIAIDLGSGAPAELMKDAFTWMRTRYLLSYEPPPGKGWHKLNVRVNRRGVVVTLRDGYFVN